MSLALRSDRKRSKRCKASPRGQLEQLEICVSGSLEHSSKSGSTVVLPSSRSGEEMAFLGLLSDA